MLAYRISLHPQNDASGANNEPACANDEYDPFESERSETELDIGEY